MIVDIFKQEREDTADELCQKQTGITMNYLGPYTSTTKRHHMPMQRLYLQ